MKVHQSREDESMTSTIPAKPSTSSVRTTGTRALLGCGAIAGPLYIAVSLIQAFTRDGFELRRHPFSMLSLGEWGWIQITNFVVAGVLYLACAIGLQQVVRTGRGRTWGPLLFAGIGVGLIAGGVFVADPALGFPAGAPAGSPEELTWHGALHGVAFAAGIGSLLAAFFVFARWFAARGERGWARYCVATGVAFVALSAVGMAGSDYRLVTVAILIGFGWAAIITTRLITQLPR